MTESSRTGDRSSPGFFRYRPTTCRRPQYTRWIRSSICQLRWPSRLTHLKDGRSDLERYSLQNWPPIQFDEDHGLMRSREYAVIPVTARVRAYWTRSSLVASIFVARSKMPTFASRVLQVITMITVGISEHGILVKFKLQFKI